MNPLQRIMSQTLRYIQRHFAKMAALMLAVLVAVGSLLPYDAMPVLAAEDTEDYCHLSLELYPEGETAEKTVVLNGVMPKEASATAVDVTDDFIGREGGTDLSEENPHAYAVTYHYGTPASQTHGTDVIDNVRTDTITNTRTDGIALTLFDMHTLEPLAQGQFTLTQGDTILGRYTSDAQGRITVFYDFERNTDYTLTETEPPAGYIGLPNAAVFSIGSDDTVTISGNEPQWQKVRTADPATDHVMAYIDVYNKPYTLTVLKVDSVTAELKASNARSTGAKKTRFPWPTGIGYIYTNNCGRYCL